MIKLQVEDLCYMGKLFVVFNFLSDMVLLLKWLSSERLDCLTVDLSAKQDLMFNAEFIH